MTEVLNVGIVGCGLIGRKRAASLGLDRVLGCYDVSGETTSTFANDFETTPCKSMPELLALKPDIVIVSTTHNELTRIACQAMDSGAHVLVEKPGGIGTFDIAQLETCSLKTERSVKIGFNHRFHPAIERAITEARSGDYGDVLYLRARYGHGGRPGYESEWRANAQLAGGGEIVDQGMHLLDLSHWLLGELPLHSSLLRTQFWKTEVDDNAVMILGEQGGAGNATPFSLLHVSWTDWKNIFSLEIACTTAKFEVVGLANSYGSQTYRHFQMRPELGPPDLIEVEFPNIDVSWTHEWKHFRDAVTSGDSSQLMNGLASARYAWSCIEDAQRR